MPEESIDKNLKIRYESFKNYIIENNFKFGDYFPAHWTGRRFTRSSPT
jgi:hypothetical protein